jgi:hypothetical protein
MQQIKDFVADGSRYPYDFKLCTAKKGWAQFDTKQDASYYGNWVNPTSMELVSYCEGDSTYTKCESEAEFAATLLEMINWHKEREYFIGIDGMCRSEIIERFTALGFATYLH